MNPGVDAWWAENQGSQLWLSVPVLGEVRRGVDERTGVNVLNPFSDPR
jgi:hypothetical protein